jgi:hypothetical protein
MQSNYLAKSEAINFSSSITYITGKFARGIYLTIPLSLYVTSLLFTGAGKMLYKITSGINNTFGRWLAYEKFSYFQEKYNSKREQDNNDEFSELPDFQEDVSQFLIDNEGFTIKWAVDQLFLSDTKARELGLRLEELKIIEKPKNPASPRPLICKDIREIQRRLISGMVYRRLEFGDELSQVDILLDGVKYPKGTRLSDLELAVLRYTSLKESDLNFLNPRKLYTNEEGQGVLEDNQTASLDEDFVPRRGVKYDKVQVNDNGETKYTYIPRKARK